MQSLIIMTCGDIAQLEARSQLIESVGCSVTLPSLPAGIDSVGEVRYVSTYETFRRNFTAS